MYVIFGFRPTENAEKAHEKRMATIGNPAKRS